MSRAAPAFSELPVEILTLICQHLLHVETMDSNAERQMHTSILRASRDMHEIGKNVPYGQNAFVRISQVSASDYYPAYTTGIDTDLVGTLRSLLVPVTSTSFPASSPAPVLEIDFGEGLWGPRLRLEIGRTSRPTSYWAAPAVGTNSCMMLYADLDLFIRACRIVNHIYPGFSNQIIISQAPWLDVVDRRLREPRGFRTTVTFSKAFVQSTTKHVQRDVLERLEDMVGKRKTSVVDSECINGIAKVVRFEETLWPKIVWLDAMGWNFLNLLRSWKADIDERYRRARCTYFLVRAYELLSDSICMNDIWEPLSDTDASRRESERKHWRNALEFLYFDVNLSLAHVCLYRGDLLMSAAFVRMTYGSFRIMNDKFPDTIGADRTKHCYHTAGVLFAEQGYLEEACRYLKTACHWQDELYESDRNWIAHGTGVFQDYAAVSADLKRQADKSRKISSLTFVTSTLSRSFPLFDCIPAVDGERPDGLYRWQDYRYRLTLRQLQDLEVTWEDVPH